MKVIDVIQDERIILLDDMGQEVVFFIGDFDIDCDGSGGNPDGDPFFQPDTALHHKGKALNAYEVPYVVVPPVVVRRTKGVVLGSQAYVTNLRLGITTAAVVGDVGPQRKTGEGSVELAKRLKVSWNPKWGGEHDKIIGYAIQVGVRAQVDGVTYDLQAS